MGSACRLSTNVIRLSKSISKHSLRSFLHCAECVFLAPSGSAKFIAFWCKKNRRATVAEVIGTTLMKFSDGFTRLWPSVATIVCYCTAFYLLAQTLSTIPTGIAYAIWSGAGIVLISLLGWLVSGQKLDFPAIAGMFLICAGVLVINIFSKSSPH